MFGALLLPVVPPSMAGVLCDGEAKPSPMTSKNRPTVKVDSPFVLVREQKRQSDDHADHTRHHRTSSMDHENIMSVV